MYIDYLKNDYSDKDDSEKKEYIARDKKHLAGLVQEKITNDISNIVERWYELSDIGYISENEKFLYLLKEAEQLYCFSYYTGTIAIIGIAAEEYCRYLVSANGITDADKQADRINKLKDTNIIDEVMKVAFHRIRKIRNDCMHYNVSFKSLEDNQLKDYALEMIQAYKKCLSPLAVDMESNYNKFAEDILRSQEITFREFIYRNRNIQREVNDLDLQIHPQIHNLIFTSRYYIVEVDIDSCEFKEMTLADMERCGFPVVVDLTLPQAQRVSELKLEAGNIILATILSTVTTIGQTEEWHLLNIHDIYRESIALKDLDTFIKLFNEQRKTENALSADRRL